ncbi:MAG: PaaI family thioesterase [Candidatus Binataceae bacterium]
MSSEEPAAKARNWKEEFGRRIAGTMIAAHGTIFREVSPDHAILELPFKPALAQMTGIFHAGAILALADEACTALAAAFVMGDGEWDPAKFPLTIQLSANLIRNTDRGKLIAEARPVHRGRTTAVVQTEVKDEAGRMIAVVTATLVIPSPKPSP